jgi:hypothetical protein
MSKEEESDNDSVATEDVVEEKIIELEPEPEPVTEKADPILPQPEDDGFALIEPKKPKPKGRPKLAKTKPDKTPASLFALTKDELVKLVTNQHDLLNRRALIDKEQEDFIKQKTTNKIGKTTAKEKKARTPAQVEATKRMVEARKAKRASKLKEVKDDIVLDIDNSIADRVEECVANIIMKPMRSLTPERLKKLETYIEPKKKSRF